MHAYDKLLLENKAWAHEKVQQDPDYFNRLAHLQTPEFLWIGCSDSRVPANEITNTQPGEIFVHRNVANLVVNGDLNMLSVLQYSVEVLKVQHVIVVGHYGCSGVHAALTKRRVGLADNWLRHVEDVHQKYTCYLSEELSETVRHDRLCELNVIEQVANICRTTIVQEAWERGQPLTIHSWVYGLQDGLLRDLGVTVSAMSELMEAIELGLQRYP